MPLIENGRRGHWTISCNQDLNYFVPDFEVHAAMKISSLVAGMLHCLVT